jgi:replication factor C small subunit
MKNDIWVEKYRPSTLDELILEPMTREILDKLLEEKTIPHLLLSGNVGCGKTTIAKILLNALDCDHIELNASAERGIETIRKNIRQFAMMSTMKKLKVVFMDEADALTPDAQFALRNIMETYSGQTRFILTANYLSKIIDPIQSRCQPIVFKHMDKRQVCKLLKSILEKERVQYSIDDLLLLIDDHYPDVRGTINKMQLDCIHGVFKYEKKESLNDLTGVLDLIKKGDLSSIRKLDLDYTEGLKFLFNKVDDLTADYEKRVKISLDVSEYLYRDGFTPDREINFAACCLMIITTLGIKAK